MLFILRVRPNTMRLVLLIDKHTINHILELEGMLLRTVVRLVSAVFKRVFKTLRWPPVCLTYLTATFRVLHFSIRGVYIELRTITVSWIRCAQKTQKLKKSERFCGSVIYAVMALDLSA